MTEAYILATLAGYTGGDDGVAYIKNADTRSGREVAELLGTSKTAAVHDALLHRKRELEQERRLPGVPLRERMKAGAITSPGSPDRPRCGQGFYDSLNDEDDD